MLAYRRSALTMTCWQGRKIGNIAASPLITFWHRAHFFWMWDCGVFVASSAFRIYVVARFIKKNQRYRISCLYIERSGVKWYAWLLFVVTTIFSCGYYRRGYKQTDWCHRILHFCGLIQMSRQHYLPYCCFYYFGGCEKDRCLAVWSFRLWRSAIQVRVIIAINITELPHVILLIWKALLV